jgi:hypothetical protein
MPRTKTDAEVNTASPVIAQGDTGESVRLAHCSEMVAAIGQSETIVQAAATRFRSAMSDADTISYDDAEVWRVSFMTAADTAGVSKDAAKKRWERTVRAVKAAGLEFLPSMTEKAVKAREARERRRQAVESARQSAGAIVDIAKLDAKESGKAIEDGTIAGQLVESAKVDIKNGNLREAAAKLIKAADLLRK